MVECEPCAHAAEHGWWGASIPSSTHCGTCHTTWPMTQKWGHCSRCHQTFAGIHAFDVHQRTDEEDGELTEDCLCSILTNMGMEDVATLPAGLSFDVSKKTTLELRTTTWGMAWGVRDETNPWKEDQ